MRGPGMLARKKETQAGNTTHPFGGHICDSILNTRLSSWNNIVLNWENGIHEPVIRDKHNPMSQQRSRIHQAWLGSQHNSISLLSSPQNISYHVKLIQIF